MKISIRIKFFIVLLAFSLGPIFLSRGIMGKALMAMSGDLTRQTREELNLIVAEELEANAVSMAEVITARGEAMTLAARMLAMEAGRALSQAAPPEEFTVYFSRNFEPGDKAPSDLAANDLYLRHTRQGNYQPMFLSFKHPAFHVAHDADVDAHYQARQLRDLGPALTALYGELSYAPYWLNIALESGLFMTYPGHGKLPKLYDPRDLELYRRTRQSRTSVWQSPLVDPSTRSAMAAIGSPIFIEDGSFTGVASVEIPISSVLNDAELRSRWKGDIRSFMVILTQRDGTDKNGLQIVAQQSVHKGGRRHWMTGIEKGWLESSDEEGFKELLQLMERRESGVVELPFRGVPSVWAFSMDMGFRFLLITPKAVAEQLPNAIAGSVTNLFDELRDVASIIGGVMLIITGLIAWFGSRTITKPLLAIAEAARRLGNGDFSARILMRTGDERDALVDTFNEMGPKLEEHMRISKDLELAQEVQKLLLPYSEPEVDGFDLSGGISYCDQTGGDYYDFIDMKSAGRRAVGVVLGDVSGHGVPSALIMATARGQLHSLAQVDIPPVERISAINSFLSEDLDGTGRFLTMFYLRLEAGSSFIRWVRAGHDPAIRYTPQTDTFSELRGQGLPLGVMAGCEFEEREDSLQPGEILLMATDGVWEARNAEGKMFGKQRILAIIRDNAHKDAETIRRSVMNAVKAYQRGDQEDDIAVVVVKKI